MLYLAIYSGKTVDDSEAILACSDQVTIRRVLDEIARLDDEYLPLRNRARPKAQPDKHEKAARPTHRTSN
jgi:hypothetical protein